MNKCELLVTLQAQPRKEAEVEDFLKSGRPLVLEETKTTTSFAFKIGSLTFGIFDTFADEDGQNAHINGEIEKALFACAEELFAAAPQIQQFDLLAEKV